MPCEPQYLIDVFWMRYYGLRGVTVYHFESHGSACLRGRGCCYCHDLQSTNTDEGRTRLWCTVSSTFSTGTGVTSTQRLVHPLASLASPHRAQRPRLLFTLSTNAPTASLTPLVTAPSSLSTSSNIGFSPHPRTPARPSHVRWRFFTGVRLFFSGEIYRPETQLERWDAMGK